MRRTWLNFLGTMALSWGVSTVAWGQAPPAPPAPGPTPPGAQIPAPPPGPLPTPLPAPAPTPAPTVDASKGAEVPAATATPTQAAIAPAAPGGITVTTPGQPTVPATGIPSGAPNPGSIGCGRSCLPCPILKGGCLEAILPHGCGGGTWVAGGGVYVMAPYFSGNSAYSTARISGTAVSTSQQNFGNRMSVAPLGFLGYTWNNGWGVRFRWFQFEQNSSVGQTFDAATRVSDAGGQFYTPVGPNSTVAANSHLFLSAYDLEATYLAKLGQWTLLGSAGARYAQISQGYSFALADSTTGTTSTTNTAHSFNGFGPTVSFEGHYKCGGTNFGLYSLARGSILFGSGNVASAFSSPTTPLTVGGSYHETSVIPVGEIEAGGEWGCCWGRCRVFAQVGVVGQIWWGAGNASQGIYLSGAAAGTPSTPANLGFIGGVARLGVSF